MKEERRRAPRVGGEFWVGIQGIDAEPYFTSGDLSTSGVCFVRSEGLTELGTVEMLSIAVRDRSVGVFVLAQLVRTGTAIDRATGQSWPTAAFAFLPDNAHVNDNIKRLYDRLVQERGETPAAHPRTTGFGATGGNLDAEAPARARVLPLTINRMQIEASWPVSPGDKVQVVFQPLASGGARIPFEGVATRVARDASGAYIAEVQLGAARARTAFSVSTATTSPTITRSVDLVFTSQDLEAQNDTRQNLHLAGRLERISVASLFSFFELERMSGELRLRIGDTQYTLFWLEGRPIDLEHDDGSVEQKESLARIVRANEGSFRFVRKAIERADQIGLSATQLLLDLAREADEAAR